MIALFNIYVKPILPIVVLVLFVYMFRIANNNRIRKVHTRLLLENPGLASTSLFSVNYSSVPLQRLNFLSPKDTGILTLNQNKLGFLGYQSPDTPIKLYFKLDELEARWVGKTSAFSSDYWFLFKSGNESHYFSAETGAFSLTNEQQTRELFETIKNRVEQIMNI